MGANDDAIAATATQVREALTRLIEAKRLGAGDPASPATTWPGW
jgi:hypothetical protein